MRADRRRFLYATSAIVISCAVVVDRCIVDVEKKHVRGQGSSRFLARIRHVPEPHTSDRLRCDSLDNTLSAPPTNYG